MIKTEKEFIYRDPDSKALLNSNRAALEEYKLKKKQRSDYNEMANRVKKLEEVVEMLLSRLSDIKE